MDKIVRVINDELYFTIQYFNINKIVINYNKTNYVVITSTEKKSLNRVNTVLHVETVFAKYRRGFAACMYF
jgi:hypothetical protein